MKYVQLHTVASEDNPSVSLFVNLAVVVYLQRTKSGTVLMLPYGTLEVTETPAQIKALADSP